MGQQLRVRRKRQRRKMRAKRLKVEARQATSSK